MPKRKMDPGGRRNREKKGIPEEGPGQARPAASSDERHTPRKNLRKKGGGGNVKQKKG